MELFEISYNNYIYRYNNSPENLVSSGGYTYYASSIIRKDLTTDISKAECNLTISSLTKPFDLLLSENPIIPIQITIKFYPEETIMFDGLLDGLEYNINTGDIKVHVSSKIAIDELTIPKVTYSNYCSWELFSPECGKIAENYKVTLQTNNTIYSNLIITNDILINYVTDYFKNGYIKLDTGETMLITHNDNNFINILLPIETFNSASKIFVYPGCDKTIDTCINKYNNLPNFSGFPYIPNNNPVSEEF